MTVFLYLWVRIGNGTSQSYRFDDLKVSYVIAYIGNLLGVEFVFFEDFQQNLFFIKNSLMNLHDFQSFSPFFQGT